MWRSYGKAECRFKCFRGDTCKFLREEAGKVGFKKVVLGLSGGIDSALVAFLAAKAFGPENVLGIMMPYKTSSKESVEHAKLVIEKLE